MPGALRFGTHDLEHILFPAQARALGSSKSERGVPIKLTESTEWRALEAHATSLRATDLRDLFANDADRFAKLSRTDLNLLFDFSRQRVTVETIQQLVAL